MATTSKSPDLLALLSESTRLNAAARKALWRTQGPSELTEALGEMEAEAWAAVEAVEEREQ